MEDFAPIYWVVVVTVVGYADEMEQSITLHFQESKPDIYSGILASVLGKFPTRSIYATYFNVPANKVVELSVLPSKLLL